MPLSSPADICTLALSAVGSKLQVSELYDGSPQGRACLDIYSETRDEVLRAGEWSFAYGQTELTLLKGPPPPGGYPPMMPWSTIYPPANWLYEYVYPSDCIELRDIIKMPAGLPILDPKPALWRVDNDSTPTLSGPIPPIINGMYSGALPTANGPPQRVILCNISRPLAIYTRRVTDPLLWEPLYIATLVDALAKKLSVSPMFASSSDLMKSLPAETAATGALAQQHQG